MTQKTNPVPYHNWSDEEVYQLNEGIRLYGIKFAHIQQAFLPHISAQIIKNKYYKLYKKGEITPSNIESKQYSNAHSGSHTGINTPKDFPDQVDIDFMLADLNQILKRMQ
ncbi:hypothetical protein SS50377_28617 [Spironucleus salmonicida]|uniref:Myb-like DNA-binding domain-containing protein n=1 Tax=Spironucleus salmonicida TaxID=348837 RepID=V6LBD8_9EUKA|nr:hypothetical protein SS50377_28617 [Spironucleus salmonicida]|eukprot:EST41563.1 Hypothetical protein SS50377_18904 [Spironucleus salmonicida]